MKIFKFGGGVINCAEAIRTMTRLVQGEEQLYVVVSAFNKMTNSLEALVRADGEQAEQVTLQKILDYHSQLARELLINRYPAWEKKMQELTEGLRSILKSTRTGGYDYRYDQIVCYGEIFSSTLISAYWDEVDLIHVFEDARQVILTDSAFREARVNWNGTAKKLQQTESKREMIIDLGGIVLIQGFIAADNQANTTTLGREGSDYTAAILGNLLNAEEVVIWKDVPGIMTADPAEFQEVHKLEEISYLEAVELSYFGAKVIHPNTIKPLQNKGIPLVVKSFLSPLEPGTRIINEAHSAPDYPIIIRKQNQVLVSIQARDFSFIVEEAMARIFMVLSGARTRINLMQHGAVSISLVMDYNQSRLDAILGNLLPEFKVLYNTGLELWTVRHYSEEAIERIVGSKRIYVQQKSRHTARFVLG